MPIVIINTPAEAQLFAQRLIDEPERVKLETGKGPGAMRFGIGSIMRAIEQGDVLALAYGGVEGHRIAIWAHHEPGQGIHLLHVWGPSVRHLGVLRWIAQKLNDRGFGALFGHFPNIDMPTINLAKAIVLPATGNYNAANVWTASPAGRLCRVRLDAALSRLIAAGAPVEA